MRILGLDIGEKIIGISISDRYNIIASSFKNFYINKTINKFNFFKKLLLEYDIKKIIIGFPKNMNNTIGLSAKKILNFGNKLKKIINIPIIYFDERCTTQQIEKFLIKEINMSRKKRKKIIDKLSAVIILQNYLDLINFKKNNLNK